MQPDVVVHAIAYTESHARDVVDLFSGTDTRFVVLSSQDCYEAFYQLNRGRDVAELPISEDGPICATTHYWNDLPGTKTYPDYDKNLVTATVLSAHKAQQVQACVLRLPMVFGPGDFQFKHRHGKFIRRIFDQQRTLVMGAVEQTSLFTFGYIDNVAAAIIRAVETPIVDGKIFNIGESKSRSLRRWAELYAEAAGTAFDFQILPDALTERDQAALNNPPRLILFNCRNFCDETGFIEPVSLAEQVRQTLVWGLDNPESLGVRPNYEHEHSLVEAYRCFVQQTLQVKNLGES